LTLEPLNEIERRILGVLMEKSITQPEYYPMTVNAVVTACNQKNNRDPVMDLDEASIEASLEDLRKRGLVSMVLPAPGARTRRYRHETAGRYGWEKRVAAIMTELLLRGPQTPGELRSRASRMAAFENVEAVQVALDHMQQSEPSLVKPLPRQTGQSAVRYMHLLYPPEEITAIEASVPAVDTVAADRPAARPAAHALQAEVDELKATVAQLGTELNDLRRRFESLESQLK
jgi:uncharacterized protein YceH (UPF0502 family)